jgi:hypothetical protein
MRRPVGCRFSPFSRRGQVPSCRTAEKCACRLGEIVNRKPAAIQFRRLLAASAEIAAAPHTRTRALTRARVHNSSARGSQNDNSRVRKEQFVSRRGVAFRWLSKLRKRVPIAVVSFSWNAFPPHACLLAREIHQNT